MIRNSFLPFGAPSFSREEIEAVSRVIESGWIGMGRETLQFEKELAAFLGAPNVVLVNSCTSALFLSLLVHGIGPGDEVICPSLTWCSTANAALYLGAKVRFCDVDPWTLCANAETILAKVTARTRAVLVVHYGGFPAEADQVCGALPPGVAVVEDAAHAIGAFYADGRKVGSAGRAACFSFYANKNITTGEGGAVALGDAALAGRLNSLRQHGLPADAWRRYTHPQTLLPGQITELGYKMNLTDLQAAIGRVQLRRLPAFQAVRLEIARYFHDRLSREAPSLRFQAGILEEGHARHLFVVRLPLAELSLSRDAVVLELRRRNIGASIHYAPLHLMPLYGGKAGRSVDALPDTEQVCREILTLPISAKLTQADAEYVCGQFLEVLRAARRQKLWELLPSAPVPSGDPARYGFYGRLSPLFPSQVIIDVTDVCNLACIHCPQPLLRKSGHYAAAFLDPALCEKAVDEVREAGKGICGYIRYTGEGEPLIHREILRILEYAVRRSGTTVALTTNGTLMDERLAEGLLDTGVHLVDISIDAFRPETYRRIRVNGNLEVTRSNVLRLIRLSRERQAVTKVVVSYIEQPENREETADFQSFWREAGADYVVVRRLHSAAGAIDHTADEMRMGNRSLARRACTYPWERIVLNPLGFLCYCPAGWSHSARIADYREAGINETWRGESYQRLRRAHLASNYAGHSFCEQCPDWSATRWPDEGRSYADLIEDFQPKDMAVR